MEGFTQTVAQLRALVDEAKQVYDYGKLTNGQMLENSRNRIQDIAGEIYNKAILVNTGSIVFDNLIRIALSEHIYWSNGYQQTSIRNMHLNNHTWYTYMKSMHPNQMSNHIQCGVSQLNSLITQLENTIQGFDKDVRVQFGDPLTMLQMIASTQMQVEILKNNQAQVITEEHISNMIAEAMKPKDDEIAALKQRIEVLEKAVNPMPDYDYEMYANHIAPFKDELIIAGRMMSKMYLGRSRLPVATIVSKQ